MPNWVQDAGMITAVVLVFNALTGRMGSAITWIAGRRDARRARRESEKKAREATKALQRTIELQNVELGIKDRIIAAMTEEMDRLHRNGGAK